MDAFTSRERIYMALNHQEADRIAIEDHPWATTLSRWRREGMPLDRSPEEFFGYEMYEFGFDASLQLPSEVIEETDEFILTRNGDGATSKTLKNSTTTPHWVDFLIRDRRTWREHKPRMVMNSSRISWDESKAGCQKARESGLWIRLVAGTGYDRVQTIVGSESLLIAMLDDPEWVKDMFSTVGELVVNAAEEILSKGFEFDGVVFCQDMGYRNAAIFSPALYREIAMPVDRRLCDFFHGKGLKTMLHSCGRVTELVPHLIEAGFDSLEPLEVKAGMDLLELKARYGEKLAFMGGIDARKMADPDPEVIHEEIRSKITAAMRGGGYIYHSDHSVPDNVSLEQYRRVLDLVRWYGSYNTIASAPQ